MRRMMHAFLRRMAYVFTAPWCTEHVYMDPEEVNWRSAIRSRWFGTLAFRDLHGHLSFKW
jgi:hypothetical protein